MPDTEVTTDHTPAEPKPVGSFSSGGSSSSIAISPPAPRPSHPATASHSDRDDFLEKLVMELGNMAIPEWENLDVPAMVTRLLDRKETLSNPDAIKAIRKEADGLLKKGTWDINTVMEQSELLKGARDHKQKLHLGSLMTICSVGIARRTKTVLLLCSKT